MVEAILSSIGTFIVSLKPVTIIYSYQQGVRFRFGRDVSELKPGLHWSIPLIEYINAEDTVEEVVSTSGQVITTSDEVAISAVASVRYSIKSLRLYLTKVQDFDESLIELTETKLAEEISQWTFAEALEDREGICEGLLSHLRSEVEPWGVEIHSVGLPTLAKTGVLHISGAEVSASAGE